MHKSQDSWDMPPDEPLQIIDPKNPTPVTICVDDIVLLDPSKISSHDLLQHECTVAYFIQVLMSKTDSISEQLRNIKEYFQWISSSSQVLAERIGQPLIKPLTDSIIRSSYNFCPQSTQCTRFYSRSSPSCPHHHYVHSQLKLDIDSVIRYIETCLTTDQETDVNNLYSSVKTICFVTRHMAKEIAYIHYITKNMSEQFHRNNEQKTNKPKKTRRTKPEIEEHKIVCNNRFSALFSQ